MDDRLLLLGLLRGQQMHGYQLYEFIGGGLALCTDLKKPTAYYLLNKMAQDGWVEEHTEQDGNRPLRKVYRLTAQGETAFLQLLRENLADYSRPSFPSDMGLAFLDALPMEEVMDLLRQRRAALAKSLSSAQQAPPHKGAYQWLIKHQQHFLASELAWLDELLERLAGQAEACQGE
jgi:DNA-binding PadR family transcriptional regulator